MKRLSQTRRLKPMGKAGVKGTRKMVPYRPGLTRSDPIVCGMANNAPPVFIRCDAMVFGIRHGEERWVVGDLVSEAIDKGWLLIIEQPPMPVPIDRSPPQPSVVAPDKLHGNVMYCGDCTATWPAAAKPKCMCEPPDQTVWKMLAR